MNLPMKVPQDACFLIVDDDTVSIMAMKRALKKLGLSNEVRVARDGIEALDFLDKTAAASGGSLPPLIVTLDFNMPRMNGPEFIDAICSRPAFQSLPVLMFTSSDHRQNAGQACESRIAGYLLKDGLEASLAQALRRP